MQSITNLMTYFAENRDKAEELIKNDDYPKGNLELILNRATGFSVLNEYLIDDSSKYHKKHN